MAPVAPESARLLRSTSSGGKAWVVPVPDVTARLGCAPVARSAPREGLAVVATGDAASGGGGALDDLVRGRAPVTVAPCAGADHSMLSISGIVPNGVPAAFLTAPDGTAVRADVKDNGYEFLLPDQRTTEARYVVWTGGDGTPHVQPVVAVALARPGECRGAAKLPASFARVSPEDRFGCMTLTAARRGHTAGAAAPPDDARTASAPDERAAVRCALLGGAGGAEVRAARRWRAAPPAGGCGARRSRAGARARGPAGAQAPLTAGRHG